MWVLQMLKMMCIITCMVYGVIYDLNHLRSLFHMLGLMLQFNSFRTAHERMLVCRVLFCRPRTSACTFVTCTYIFTLANSFSDFFWIKSAREVSDNFLPHILNVWFEHSLWIFLLFWDGECAKNKRLTWPSKWGWASRQWVCFCQRVCTCRAARKQQKHG
jgi:hypothetical protein